MSARRLLTSAALVLAALWVVAPTGSALAEVAAPQVIPAQAAAQADEPTAAERAAIEPLLDALGMDELLPIMREEGLSYAEDLARDMFPGRAVGRWERVVDRVYRLDRMRDMVSDSMAGALSAEDIATLQGFFDSELGRRIVTLEMTARRALLEEAVEEASREALDQMRADDDPRLDLISRFVEANELVEMNVVGALNSNFAFYQGLAAGGAFNGTLTDDQMLSEVWGQEDEIRDETIEWVYSYLGMAYQPLSDDDLTAYTDLSMTDEGRALNTGLFAAFDVLFTTISRDLGLAAATFMAGEDI